MKTDNQLRAVRVTYANGQIIDTNMAANLSDAVIKAYFMPGTVFNLGNGKVEGDGNFGDNLQEVVKCEILK